MKKATLSFLAIIMLFLIGCNKTEQQQTLHQLDTYVELWNELKFDDMYELLNLDTKATFSKDDFVQRYEKIYTDLEITNLKVSAESIAKEQLVQAFENKQTSVNITVTMDSLAGEINFTNQLDFVLEAEDDSTDEDNWTVVWNPGLIFPALIDGGVVKIEKESPKRGDILDRNQMSLAINTTAYEVGVVPELFTDKATEIAQIASLLNVSAESIENKLSAAWVEPNHFIPIKIIPKSAEHEIEMLQNLSAVKLHETSGRVYPGGKAAAHLTGYIGEITAEELAENEGYKDTDVIGKRGLELLLEDRLKGKEGTAIVIVNEQDEKTILAEDPVQNGENIQLTIDINVQERIFDAYDDKAGTASAIQADTGEVLALVSSPAFDPNDFIYGIPNEKWNELLNNPNQPLINRFTATYAPGSAIKPITAAVGLADGIITHEEKLEIKGLGWKEPNWKDFEIRRVSANLEQVNLENALITSDNIYFAKKAFEMDNDDFIKGFLQFGFGEDLPIVYPVTPSQVSKNNLISNGVLRANTSYGQGEMEVSSLHLATMYTIFTNEGNMIKPTLMLDEPNSDIWHEQLISKEDSDIMQTYLRKIVTEGSGRNANVEELDISGKTGTAELKLSQDSDGLENAWFVGYPTIDQDIIIAMMVEDTGDIGASGYVTELVKDILVDLR